MRRKLTIEAQEQVDDIDVEKYGDGFEPGQSMSMSEALARSKGDDLAVMESLNKDSMNAGLGSLFEYETG